MQINDHIHAGMVGLYTLEGDPIEEKDIGIDILRSCISLTVTMSHTRTNPSHPSHIQHYLLP